MLNSQTFYNSRPDGFGVLEVASDPSAPDAPRKFVPLMRTALTGTVTGPLATLTLAQNFALPDQSTDILEALYRFPLPGDAAVTGVRVRFGDVEIRTTLKAREAAETDYKEAKRAGRQAALVTRESPDVFTLAVAGIRAGQDIVVQTDYVQVAKVEGAGWALRVPLTTAPRYVRADEADSRHADGQPLAVLRDPGHRFALDLTVREAERIASPTHALAVEGDRVRLREGEALPDRDCVISWGAKTEDAQPALRTWVHADPATEKAYFLALCAPPKFASAKKIPREVVLLVDHSGSMRGAKWEAADWAVERFLAGMSEHDSFALGLFHDTTKWFAERPRKATPDVVREAVAFLKTNHDSGGTELGVALEQALDRARVADTPSRHVLILTDAEVSDAGRVLRLADLESEKPNRRRVSVLCIDAAPNAALASELAERGGGVSRFLTSSPDEDDVTTALDEVLADWSAPVLTGLTLEVNRVRAEATGRTVALVVPGPASAVDIGDLPAGRPVWVVGRVPLDGDPLSFRLRTGAEVAAEVRADAGRATSGLKALFGADRVRRLEYVMTGGTSGDKLRAELARLSYDAADVGEEKVFAENARDTATKYVRELLVRESLAAGVPSSETAFVAVRTEAGQPVTGTVAVANGLPAGWSEPRFGSAGGAAFFSALMASPSSVASVDSMLMDFDGSDDLDNDDDGNTTTDFDPLERQRGINVPIPPAAPKFLYRKAAPPPPSVKVPAPQVPRPGKAPPLSRDIRVNVKAGQHVPADGVVLYDSATGGEGQLTFLAVTFGDKALTADQLDPELTLLLFVGDLASPRARVKLVDVLRQGGRRPLNVRRAANQPVRLALEDPAGAWTSGVPALEIVLGWKD
ncbi:VWA domain-containing protein [Gemmata sp. G18]|uniref:VWA domain-containing protein n=1 Tax=Gemmata palustris TaxID=2822762 RepID=A0ABS5C4W8_9BACT|nr:VIT and VWA domain-containing protein [Gemmata palustris]MBP3961061.1 VWA domain-containing protein [Gemmata palustris]